jgi:hypothetical protein
MDLKNAVKEKYGEAALRVSAGGSSCCGESATLESCNPVTSNLYDAVQNRATARGGYFSLARLRKSDRACATESR